MATNVEYEVEVRDVEYQQVGGKAYQARIYQPKGTGPFPTLVDVHGGAWVRADRLSDEGLNNVLAARGIVVAAIDFRMPPDAGYPASVADLNLAIRWLKAKAGDFHGSSRVGGLGVSSGAHQVILSGIRPRDPRYAALALPGHEALDASLAYIVACVPVSDPVARYHMAQQNNRQELLEAHHAYWGDEATMADGSPQVILEHGQQQELPPIVFFYKGNDAAHPLAMQERFIETYAKQGGTIEAHRYDELPQPFRPSADALDSMRAVDDMVEFIKRHGS